MRDHLNGFAEIVSFPFPFDDRFVDLARGGIGGFGKGGEGVAVVVAEIEVGFGAVVGDVDFAVLEGVHRPWIDVEIGVEFEHRDFEAAAFQQMADGCGGEPLSQGGDDSACYENIFCLHKYSSSFERSEGVSTLGGFSSAMAILIRYPNSSTLSCSKSSLSWRGVGFREASRSKKVFR